MESRKMVTKKVFSEVEGLVSEIECHILQEYARGKVCLEIGSWKGKSSVALAEVAKKVICIDTFKGIETKKGQNQKNKYTTLDIFIDNIKGYDNIKYYIGESIDILPILIKNKEINPNFIFIDGNHEYSHVYKDIKFCWELLEVGGYLFMHDYGLSIQPGVKKAIDELLLPLDGQRKLLVWKRKI